MPGKLIFDRVLDGHDFGIDLIEVQKRGIKRRGLAAARRSSDEHDAVRIAQDAEIALQVLLGEAKVVEVKGHGRFVEKAHHDGFAVNRRHGRDAHIHRLAFDDGADAAILGQTPLGDIQTRKELDA